MKIIARRISRNGPPMVKLESGKWVVEASMSNTKEELLEAATASGVEVDATMTKAEILKALE